MRRATTVIIALGLIWAMAGSVLAGPATLKPVAPAVTLKVGTWTWQASFRKGRNVAAAADAGASGGHFDGAKGKLTIPAISTTRGDNSITNSTW